MIETEFREDTKAKSKAFYSTKENLAVTKELINQLYAVADGKNARLCLHQGAEDGFHQMLILEYKGKSFPAHRHPAKSEGYHLIYGVMDLILFDEFGNETGRYCLQEDRCPIARVGPNTIHSLEVISDYAIYLESKPGPFVREFDKVIPVWAQKS